MANIGPLTATYYSDKSIVVRGNTEPYREHLKNIGGRWNGHLKDGAGGGWIFAKTKEADVVRVVNAANAGQLQQAAPIPRKDPTTSAPISTGTLGSTLSGQGVLPGSTQILGGSLLTMQQTNAPLTAPEPIIHETEQVVSYKLSIPKVGQDVSVHIVTNGAVSSTIAFQVVNLIRSQKNVVDAIIIQMKDNPTQQGMLLNVNGQWKLDGQAFNGHMITF